MRLRIAKISEQAKDRPAGYFEDVISRGFLDGEWLEISSDAMASLRETYRPPKPEPPLPSLPVMAVNVARAVGAEAVATFAGSPAIPKEEAGARFVICQSCTDWFRPSDERCAHPACGCYLRTKTAFRAQHCPIGKW